MKALFSILWLGLFCLSACQLPATRLTTGSSASDLFKPIQANSNPTVVEVIPLNIETPEKQKLSLASRLQEGVILLNIGDRLNFVFNFSGQIPNTNTHAIWSLKNPMLGQVNRNHTFTALQEGETVLTLNLEGSVFNYLLKIRDPNKIEVPSLNSSTKPITDFTVFIRRISPGTLGGDQLAIFDSNQTVPVSLEVADDITVSRINISAHPVNTQQDIPILTVNDTNILNSLWNPVGHPAGEYEMEFRISSDRFGEVILRRRFVIRSD